MKTNRPSVLSPADVAGRLALVAVFLMRGAVAGLRGRDRRLLAKALYALAAANNPVPGETARQWTAALFGQFALNAGDPTPLEFFRRAGVLRREERTVFNGVFAEPPTPQSVERLMSHGSGLVAFGASAEDLLERGFGLAMLVVAEVRYRDHRNGLLAAVADAREAAYADDVDGLGLWQSVSGFAEMCERALREAAVAETETHPVVFANAPGGDGRVRGAYR
jgi:hypothetical protein